MRPGVRQLLPKRGFDFSGISSGGSVTVVLGDIDASAIGDAVLGLRIHTNATTGTSSMVVSLHNKSYAPDDPDTNFTSVDAVASVTVDASTGVASLLMAGLLPGFGGCLELRLTATRNGSDTLIAELSVELVARRGVAAPRRSLADTLVVGNATAGTDLVITSGDALAPDTDDAVDVGSAAARFRTLHAGTSVQINNQTAARVVEAMQVSTLRI